MEYLTTTEISKLWGISTRRIQILCKEGRVEGAVNKGIWLIPADAKKPEDPRKDGKTYAEGTKESMLKIYFGDRNDAIYNTSVYFKNTFLDDWITDPFSAQMIKDVDSSEVVGPHLIQSPVLGPITPKELSGGVKTLILIYKDKDHIFNASNCGDNCAKWILKMAEKEDITINLRHLMDFGAGDFNIEVLNDGKIVHNMAELIDAAGEYV